MIKIPKPKFQVGDKIWANCHESEINPFEAIIYEVKFDIWTGELTYALFEDNKGMMSSDGWEERMLSRSYPR